MSGQDQRATELSQQLRILHRQKIAFAKNLLSDTTLLVKEIAAILGFEDPFYFSAQFRKHVGTSPSAYRDTARADWQAPASRG
jgi:AraC family transcriptional regulator, arabinose operon regulatory protein